MYKGRADVGLSVPKDAGKAFYLLGEKGINGKVYCIGGERQDRLRIISRI